LAAAGREYALSVLSRASSESIARTKRLLLAALGQPLEVALDLAVEANAAARGTEDCRHGIRHFLREKKTPDWRAPR
jgi:methylglutaconyl-CoA hydratase